MQTDRDASARDTRGRDTSARNTRTGDARDTRSFGELFSQLAGDLGLLVQQEIALAKKEFQTALVQAGIGVVALAVALTLATVGLIAVLTSVILALALVMPHWAAALVVGLIFIVLAGVAAYLGIQRLRKLKLIPERTAQTLRDDVAMIREKAQ